MPITADALHERIIALNKQLTETKDSSEASKIITRKDECHYWLKLLEMEREESLKKKVQRMSIEAPKPAVNDEEECECWAFFKGKRK